MSTALLDELTRLGVLLECDGERLLVDGPENILTDELLAVIAEAKPSLLTVLASGADVSDIARPAPSDGECGESPVPVAGDVHPDHLVSPGRSTAGADCREVPIAADDSEAPVEMVKPSRWRCFACGGGERRHRETWGDWVCAFCRAIVAGPDQTERPWRMQDHVGPFPCTGPPSVVWGSERGYLAVRDPNTGDWHEIPYREAPPVWQAAVRRSRVPSGPGTRGQSDRHTEPVGSANGDRR